MDITLTGNKIVQDNKFLAFEKNSNVDVINITVDTDESWSYKLDVRYPDKCCSGEPLYNIINLTRTGNVCTAILTSDMLPFAGKYTMQLRAISGDKVKHSDTFYAWVKYSIEPGDTYNPVPSEFYQIEENITEMNNHPPYPGAKGYWMIWDITTHQYKESDIAVPDSTLPKISDETAGKYLTNDGSDIYWKEVQAGDEGKIDTIEVNGVEQSIVDKTVNIAVPTKTSDLENDSDYITSDDVPVKSVNNKTGVVVLTADDVDSVPTPATAAVGQIVKVKAVDAEGKITQTEAVDMEGDWEFITEIKLNDAASVITINQDANGNAFALKRVMIDCVIQPDTADKFTYIKTKINGYIPISNAEVHYDNTNLRYYAFYAELIPSSGALCWHACFGMNYNWEGGLQKMGYKYNGLWGINAITSLEIGANDGGKNIGIAGTTVHVMGVKA